MIRICKNADKPQTLDKSYNTDEVCKQLLMDQNDKCYLCERRLTTDYQVEHFKSQANNGDLKQTWENLFVACGYKNSISEDISLVKFFRSIEVRFGWKI